LEQRAQGWGGKQIERKFEEMRQNNEQSSSQCACGRGMMKKNKSRALKGTETL
jgi:hypothetical protein